MIGALCIRRASYKRYALPLSKALTTGASNDLRQGFLLTIDAQSASGAVVSGIGEIAPLPGKATKYNSHMQHQS